MKNSEQNRGLQVISFVTTFNTNVTFHALTINFPMPLLHVGQDK